MDAKNVKFTNNNKEPDKELKNARIIPLGGYIPMANVKWFDESQKVAVGTVLEHPDPNINGRPMYFSRDYKPDINELDQIYYEYHFPAGLLDCGEFWLIPKEKVLFGYWPPSAIVLPNFQPGMRRPRVQ